MKVQKISKKNKPNTFTEISGYDHYIALDWSQDQVAIGRITRRQSRPKVILVAPRIEEVKKYLVSPFNPLKIIAVLQKNISSDFLKDSPAISSAQTSGPREVILSEYLTNS